MEILDEKLKNKQIVEDEEDTEESEGNTTSGTVSLLDENDSDEGGVLVIHTRNGVQAQDEGQGMVQDSIDMHGWTQDERTAAQYVNFDITVRLNSPAGNADMTSLTVYEFIPFLGF